MRVNRGLLGWGVFFIIAGAIPLAVQSGAIDPAVVAGAWQLWPLILIGIGLGLVLQRTRVAVVGGLVVAVTAGLIAGGALAAGISGTAGFGGFNACTIGTGDREPFPDQQGAFTSQARYTIALDCGGVEIATTPGSDWRLTGESDDAIPPELTVRADALEIRTPQRTQPTIGLGSTAGAWWRMTMPQDPATSIDLSLNAGSAEARLDGLAIDRLTASVNAGSAILDLADARSVSRIDGSVNAGSMSVSFPASNVTGSLSANAGSMELCVPAGVDLRIVLTDNALGSNNFAEEGLSQAGDVWQTPGFGSGAARIDITASANLGSIDLNPEDGCE